jgi:hypothetical protein
MNLNPNNKDDVITLSNGDIELWVDPGAALHMKCVTKHGDPVELSAEEIKELCAVLERLIGQIE